MPQKIAPHVDVVADLIPKFWPSREILPNDVALADDDEIPDEAWSRCRQNDENPGRSFTNLYVLAKRYGFEVMYTADEETGNSLAVASFHRQMFDPETLLYVSEMCELARIQVDKIVGKNHDASDEDVARGMRRWWIWNTPMRSRDQASD